MEISTDEKNNYWLFLPLSASLPVFGYEVSESTALVPIPTTLVVCQAFRDVAGRNPLGRPFGKEAPPFSNTLIRVGSIFCSDAAAVQAYLSSRPADGNPTVRAIARPYVTVLLGVGFSFYNVNKQVLADGSATPLTLPSNETTSGYIYYGTGVEASQVSCQLYEDLEGTKETGKALSTLRQFDISDEDDGYVASKVKAIRCKRIWGSERFRRRDAACCMLLKRRHFWFLFYFTK